MPDIDRHAIIEEWIAAANAHETDRYLSYFADDAVLDDPSVGRVFEGRGGIADYYESYFIGYDTHTRLIGAGDEHGHLHVEVEFTGDFPRGRTGGIFDIAFAGAKLSHVRADLIERA